jgi:hypothetical protein
VSYVTQYFPSGTLEIGSDIDNALSVIDRSLGKQIRDAVAYASFCEIMPEVHRGYYQVEEVASGFNLRHIVLDAVG